MIDQATQLRKLVLQSVRQQVAAAGPSPRLVAVTSGRTGVGVTTIAVNLSVALAEHGSRVVLVDADLNRSDVAMLCGIPHEQGVHDVVFARRDIHEVMQRGPAGIQVVPGRLAPGAADEWSAGAQQRLLRQLNTLGRHAEVVVLDVGGGDHGFLKRCCEAADQMLFVTTPAPMCVMDTYARIKTIVADRRSLHLQLVVNQCEHVSQSRDVHQGIDQSCQRFLKQEVEFLGAVPSHVEVRRAVEHAMPFVVAAPACPAAAAVSQLAATLLQGSRSKDDRRKAA